MSIASNIEARELTAELVEYIGIKIQAKNFMARVIELLEEAAGLVEKPVEQKLEPVARLGATEIPFGRFAGKTFDDADLEYLDWLCRSQEDFYKGLRAYLRHPDLFSHRPEDAY